MKLIKPDFAIIEQQPGIQNLFKHIERCGRVCYKSEDKITDTSAVDFVARMIRSKHGTVLEHGTVYLKITEDMKAFCPNDVVEFYKSNKYSRVNTIYDNKFWEETHYITTNFRVISDNKRYDDLRYMAEPCEHHELRHTVLFTCDIGVSREFNRHRVNSANEESTRYCNYGKSKFEHQLSIILPKWLDDIYAPKDTDEQDDIFRGYCKLISENYDMQHMTDVDYWLFANYATEYVYMTLTDKYNWKAQQARGVLPLDTRTTLVHTAFESDWKHFFDLRARGTTGAPHPSAKELAEPLMNEFIERGYINII